jgi:hypothetical protein
MEEAGQSQERIGHDVAKARNCTLMLRPVSKAPVVVRCFARRVPARDLGALGARLCEALQAKQLFRKDYEQR